MQLRCLALQKIIHDGQKIYFRKLKIERKDTKTLRFVLNTINSKNTKLSFLPCISCSKNKTTDLWGS